MGNLTKHLESKAKGIDFENDEPVPDVLTRRGPRTAPGQLLDLQGRYEQSQQEISNLQKLLQEGGASELPITDLHEVAGRRRNLTAEQFKELVENLRTNPLVTPITVRQREQGGYEIISGHNRVNAYRVLERKIISAVVVVWDEAQTELSAFYANLLQPDLPDYEKYVGFSTIAARYPDLSLPEIAANAGISTAGIYRLMCYKSLPQESLEILEAHPDIVGASAAQALAKLCTEGKSVQVTGAIQKIAAGECTQSQAVKIAGSVPKKPRQEVSESARIKAGKATYCDMVRTEKIVRLLFSSAEEAEAAQAVIQAALQKLAREKNSKKLSSQLDNT